MACQEKITYKDSSVEQRGHQKPISTWPGHTRHTRWLNSHWPVSNPGYSSLAAARSSMQWDTPPPFMSHSPLCLPSLSRSCYTLGSTPPRFFIVPALWSALLLVPALIPDPNFNYRLLPFYSLFFYVHFSLVGLSSCSNTNTSILLFFVRCLTGFGFAKKFDTWLHQVDLTFQKHSR